MLTIILIVLLAIATFLAALILVPLKVKINGVIQAGVIVLAVDLALIYGGIKLRFTRRETRNDLDIFLLGRTLLRKELKEGKKKATERRAFSFNQNTKYNMFNPCI